MRYLPYLSLLGAAALWGSNPVLGRVIGGDVPPIALSWLRWLVALAILAPLTWTQRREIAAALRGHWRILVPLALLANVPQSALVYKGLQTTTAVNVGLLNSSIPVLILVLGAVFFARSANWLQAAGIALSIAGVGVILFQGSVARILALELNGGDLFAFGGMLTWALYTLLLPRRPPLSLLGFVACMSLIGVVLCAPAVLAEIALEGAPRLNGNVWLAILYIAAGPTLAGTLAFSYGAERVDPVHAGVFIHFMPVFASMLAIAVLGEHLHTYHFAGFALVLAGALLALGIPRLLLSPPRRTLSTTGKTHG